MEYRQQDTPAEIELTPRSGTPRKNAIERSSKANPFNTPHNTSPNTASGSKNASTVALQHNVAPPTYFKSRRIKKGEQERPWLYRKDPREKWVWIIPTFGIVLGLGLMALQVWLGLQRISKHTYCSVLDEDWGRGINEEIWTKEVEIGGFGYVGRC